MHILTPETLFHELSGSETSGFAAIQSPVHRSPNGVLYLLKPGVVVLARPEVHLGGLAGFLGGFDESLHFPEYLVARTIVLGKNEVPNFYRQILLGS